MIEPFGIAAFALSLVGTALGGMMALPDHHQLASYEPPTITHVFAANGTEIASFADETRVLVDGRKLPEYVLDAFISAEDKSFREHDGVDFRGLARAVRNNLGNLMRGRRLEGGSTITQQVAKNILLNNEVSVRRKLREMILAWRIEDEFSKREILSLYLNEIYFGQRAYGIETAARTYFGKPSTELSLSEAAYLAALPKAPNNYHPVRHKTRAIARRNYVLDRMEEDGAISAADAARAKAEPLVTILGQDDVEESYERDYFVEEVRRRLIDRFDRDAVYRGGLEVHTTLDPRLQALAQRSLRSGLMEYDRRHGWRGPVAHVDPGLLPGHEADAAKPEETKAESAPAPAEPVKDAAADAKKPAASSGGFGRLLGALTGAGKTGPVKSKAKAEKETWQTALAKIAHPAGGGAWTLAVVLDLTGTEATLGFEDGTRGVLPLSDVKWARPWLKGQRIGAAVRRMSDVVSAGDVVLVEPMAADEAAKLAKAGKPDKDAKTGSAAEETAYYSLRQVPAVNGAMVAMNPHDGSVLAMVGGWDIATSSFNRATQAMRQPGSAFKPFVYLAALEAGYSPDVTISDQPFVTNIRHNGKIWRPSNYGGDSLGWAPMHVGLEKSRNLMTLHLSLAVGLEGIRDMAQRFGIYDDMPLLYPMALGAGEVTLLNLVRGYAMIANGGHPLTAHLIESGLDRHGRAIATPPPPAADNPAVADPHDIYELITMMRGVVQRGTAARLASLGRTIAGKTGTTNDSIDAWFIGFTADLVVGAYVGFDDPQTLGNRETGSQAALPAVKAFLEEALEGTKDVAFYDPPGTKHYPISSIRIDYANFNFSGFGADGSASGVSNPTTAVTNPFGTGLY